MEIREALSRDLPELLRLYTQFKSTPIPETDEHASEIWREILADKNHHVIVAEENGIIISSCVLVIILNLTHDGRPYGVVENVVTDEAHRKQGLGTAVLNYAKEMSVRENCYKLMLMTGSKLDSTLRFYEKAGYNRNDKTAFVQWL